jgi:hypothetical protein
VHSLRVDGACAFPVPDGARVNMSDPFARGGHFALVELLIGGGAHLLGAGRMASMLKCTSSWEPSR